MITIQNKQRRFLINKDLLHAFIKELLVQIRYQDFDLGLLFTNNKGIQQYNKQYRNKDKPTDVLSFPYYPLLKPGKRIKTTSDEERNLGDIIISLEYIAEQFTVVIGFEKLAKHEQQNLVQERIIELIIHGLCHLIGYDHETDEQYRSMHRKELQLRRKVT